MASDTKDERPVPDGYEVRGYTSIYGQSRWYVDDVIHPNDFSTRDEALDAIERHRLTVCRGAIEENGFARQISDLRNADVIRERDEARTQRDAALAECEKWKMFCHELAQVLGVNRSGSAHTFEADG